MRVASASDRDEVVVLDKLTYAGRRENLAGLPRSASPSCTGAIEDRDAVREAIEGCDAVVNFAAESHVDRSIADQDAFARSPRDRHLRCCSTPRASTAWRATCRCPTDEVYGSIEARLASPRPRR